MFICDLHVIKYSFGISKDSSSVDTLPSFLGVAWSSLGGKRIFTQSIVLMILSWNLRALSDRKYVEMIPHVSTDTYSDDDNESNNNNSSKSTSNEDNATLKSSIETKEKNQNNKKIPNIILKRAQFRMKI